MSKQSSCLRGTCRFTQAERRPGIRSGRGARGALAALGLQRLEPRVLLAASISGYVIQSNAAGGGVPGVTVFMDDNRNGLRDDGERAVETDAGGRYEFANTPPGNYNILALPNIGWTAQTFGRLIGLGSYGDSSLGVAWHGTMTHDEYVGLWEIDPETGFAVNRIPIHGDIGQWGAGGITDPDYVNYAGLAAIPGHPGWYLTQTQDCGSAAWNILYELESHLVAIHWEPGMGYAETFSLLDPGYDATRGGGLDFDPTGDPNVVYGGMGDQWDWPWGVFDGDTFLWKANVHTGDTTEIAEIGVSP